MKRYSELKAMRKRIRTDWNKIKRDGSVSTFMPEGEPLPEYPEVVWAIDSGERVGAIVVDVRPAAGGHVIVVAPIWGMQEDDPDDTTK